MFPRTPLGKLGGSLRDMGVFLALNCESLLIGLVCYKILFIARRHHTPDGIEGVSPVHPPVGSGPQLLTG